MRQYIPWQLGYQKPEVPVVKFKDYNSCQWRCTNFVGAPFEILIKKTSRHDSHSFPVTRGQLAGERCVSVRERQKILEKLN